MRLFLCLFFLLDSLLLPAIGEEAKDLIARGDAFDARLKTAEALEAYLEAEKLDPNNPDLLVKIAKQYGVSTIDIEDPDQKRAVAEKALEVAKRSVELSPDSSDTHLSVALCYGRLLNLVPARTRVEYSRKVKETAEKAIQLDANSDYAWHTLGRWHRAVATIDFFLKGIVKIVYGGLPKATLEESVAALEKAAALKPDRVSHHIELGISYAEANQPDKAIAAIKRGLALPNKERDDPFTKDRGRKVLEELAE